ncbi:MAG: hypothetical protein K5739_04475, partial [Lachnospiraceae bacterium]|nr:hypothetical protein [Lachnospiraceae bacterium]
MNKRILTTMRKIRYALVACFVVMFFIGAKQTYADQMTIREGTLMVENKVFVYDKRLINTEMYDGNGGKVTYDMDTNTLTLENYHAKMVGPNKDIIFAYVMSYDKPLRVILKGRNELNVEPEKRKEQYIIRLTDTDTFLEGSGELRGNTGILTSGDLTIRDCDIRIEGADSGIYASKSVILDNADVYLTTEEPLYTSGPLCLITYNGKAGKLSLTHSNLYTEAKSGNFQSTLLAMDIPPEYDDSNLPADYMDDNKKHFFISEDTSVTDKNGNALNLCAYQWAYIAWFVF